MPVVSSTMRQRLPVVVATTLAAILSVPATYAVLRAYDVLFKNEPNPATIVWSAHIAMFWRLAVGIYVAGMVIPLALMAARANLGRTIRVLYVCVFVVAGMIGAQGLFMP
jgi:hypothetical protein